MRVVVDASAAVEIALARKRADALMSHLCQADEVLAPDLMVAEVTNILWKYHHFEALELDICERALSLAVQVPDTLVPSIELYREAFLLARAAGKPVYDMFYLALASRHDAAVLTLDAQLKREVGKQRLRAL